MTSLLVLWCLLALGINVFAEANSPLQSRKVDQVQAGRSSWALLSPTVVIMAATLEPSSSSSDAHFPNLTTSPTLNPSEQLSLMPSHNTISPTRDILDTSAEPSTEPTTYIHVPTIMIESNSPTMETTMEPSIEGSVEPSVEPSIEPSMEPSMEPSQEATTLPSTTLLEAPTFEPSAEGSNSPSMLPTMLQLQTPQPTATLHSLFPSLPAATFIRFKSSLTLRNITSNSLDSTEQSILTQSAAVQMIIAASAVRFLTFTSNSLEERRLLRKYKMLSATVAVATIETTAIFDNRFYSSPAALYANLTYDLNASVASGAFSSTMKMLSFLSNSTSKALVNAEVIAAESSVYEVITVTDDDETHAGSGKNDKDKHGLPPGIISAIVLSVSALIVVGGLTLYCYHQSCKEEEYGENFDKISL